ncbi:MULTISPECIES: PTS mannitol transporter subunit IICB [Enterobacteriaceae]|uniref:protein-N(pi)-phosphohistidine--D-mannitol phosphotransferase n=1 Tax=Klebsiella quasipneumoniae subsp. quasipneumoniae TaxID=1667327 RepID=A0AAW8XH65_9ENTR|nr:MULTISPECIES: PTS mannitol transporter subunit IICB [Enterobacteriaceae]HEM8564164.1 PTS mannitol transporter subunit IICB [Citrobacter farmeri]EFJ2365602.1 PTS mannitol transporter subunit IICB [Escherichia coli]ELR0704293.1 PTS mannitol transporter subunit IICB [Escherichia coli]ELR3257107.1 PTS mannitol transporter subunit IICB [Escherichia coli]ELR3350731.1 PTS mannitol transporter subunit IICB [Escherichia coli]
MSSSPNTLQLKIQKLGAFLSGMVMPNIGVFIAWGIITALFIPTGWYPNEYLAKLVGPTITYLLPVLIGYTGGHAIHGRRGGVIGALATMGVVIGASVTMLIGGMVMGPLAAWIMKKFDGWLVGRVKPGFEMLVDNFSIGIIGGILMIIGYAAVEPIFSLILGFLSAGVNWALNHSLIPLASIFVAPAQVLFLNNAINHGIMAPLGIQQVVEHGRSILFLVEGNSGPLVGVMVAYCLFGKGLARKTAPAATIIVMFGGIAEVYFPYVLMKPKLVLAPILGSMVSLFIFQTFDGGTVAVPSPGSVIAFAMMTPKGYFTVNLAGYFAGLIVSAIVAGILLKLDKSPVEDGEEYQEETTTSHISTAPVVAATNSESTTFAGGEHLTDRKINKIIVACDAGMGSSAMGASVLRTRAKKAMLNVTVANASVSSIPEDTDLVVTHADLLNRARQNNKNPDTQFISIKNFIEAKQYDRVLEHVQKNG